MGLITSLYEFKKPTNKNIINIDAFENLISDFEVDESDNLIESTKKFVFNNTDERIDWDNILKNHNLNQDDVDINSFGWSEEYNTVTASGILINHELYEAYKFLDSNWSDYFDTWQEFKQSSKYNEFQKYIQLMKKYGWKKTYGWYSSGNGKYSFNLVKAWEFARKIVTVDFVQILSIIVNIKSILGKEIIWVSKAQNKGFSNANDKFHCIITSKDILIEMIDNYFNQNTDGYKIQKLKEIKEQFIEGKHFVINH